MSTNAIIAGMLASAIDNTVLSAASEEDAIVKNETDNNNEAGFKLEPRVDSALVAWCSLGLCSLTSAASRRATRASLLSARASPALIAAVSRLATLVFVCVGAGLSRAE